MTNPMNPLLPSPKEHLVPTNPFSKGTYPIAAFIAGMLLVPATFAGYRTLAPSPQGSLKTISAGVIEVTDVSTSGPSGERRAEIKGSFTITPVPAGQQNPDAILSEGSGGACLIADLNRFTQLNLPQSCSLDADCNPETLKELGLTSWHGYCYAERAAPGRCWLRPGPPSQLCRTSANLPPWKDGTHQVPMNPYKLPAPTVIPLNPQDQAPVRWRVVARLNSTEPGKYKLHFGKDQLVHYPFQVRTP